MKQSNREAEDDWIERIDSDGQEVGELKKRQGNWGRDRENSTESRGTETTAVVRQ